MEYPRHWFKSIHIFRDDPDLKVGYRGFDRDIEYLKMSTGETFIHTGGNSFTGIGRIGKD